MSYEQETEVVSNEYKSMTCQVTNCIYNEKPICTQDWVELNEQGCCIFEQCEGD